MSHKPKHQNRPQPPKHAPKVDLVVPASTPSPAPESAPAEAPAPASHPVVDAAELAKDAQAALDAAPAPGGQDLFTAPPEPLTPEQLAEQERQQYAMQFKAGLELAKAGHPYPRGASAPTVAGWEAVDQKTKLRKDGPTLEQYVAAGYDPANYPPEGYLPLPVEDHHPVVQVAAPPNTFRSGGGQSHFRATSAATRPDEPAGTPTTVRHTVASEN